MYLFSSRKTCPVGRPVANRRRQRAIKTVVRCPGNMVIVFDKAGEQIPEYQGQYQDVKENILGNAPPDAVFCHLFDCDTSFRPIPRARW